MLVKIALALIIFWLIGLIAPYKTGAVIYTLPVAAIVMMIVSSHRRRLANPNEN
ncbi:MAG: hypothetical protein IH620_08000 [Ignavibacterium sp.]|nr:hypothetical protein [Ignavibacterium sp.]